MHTPTIREIGTINIEDLEIAEGKLEMRIPVDVVSEQLKDTCIQIIQHFKAIHPEVEEKNICLETRLIFCFGCANPEFSLMIIAFDIDNQDIAEFWDELRVTLSEDITKRVKKAIWEKLGETLFNL